MTNIHLKPIVTEKSTLSAQQNKYSFSVPSSVTKIELVRQLEKMYGVKVKKANAMNVRGKQRLMGRSKVFTKRKPHKKIIVTFVDSIDLNNIK